ncbi:MAG: hypothetical protein E6Q77_01970 [Rhizobium sp.]|nr:MAG: hypothetical protein E6Q77_01970 [Rhizobium sp.]
MDDDKQDKTGSGDAAKRPPPTIELTASDVSESTPASDASAEPNETDKPASESSGPSSEPKAPSRVPSILLSALTGAAAAALVLSVAKSTGWLDVPPPKPPADLVSKSDVDAFGARLAKVESDAAKPVPASRPATDPALVTRLDAVEKSLASLRGDIAAARGQNEKLAAALSEIKSASPQGVMTQPSAAVDTSVLEERIGKIERAAAALTAAAAAPPPPQPPVEDPAVRRMAAATALDAAVRQGEPYAAALAAVRSAGGDSDLLKPLDAFAASGVPTARALSRELLPLLPKLAPKPEPQPAPSGMVERLQQSAAKLVRIQRTDAAASGNAGILARTTSAAQRDDVAEAKRELLQLSAPDRAPVQAWLAKADAREAALAASRQFTSETIAALSKPAR